MICAYCDGLAVAPGVNEDAWGACCPRCDGSGMEPPTPDDEVVDVQAIVAENRNDDMAAWLGVKRCDSR